MPKGSHEKEKNGSCHILILFFIFFSHTNFKHCLSDLLTCTVSASHSAAW